MEKVAYRVIAMALFILAATTSSGHSIVHQCSCNGGPHNRPDVCSPPDFTRECDPGTTHCFYRRQLLNDRAIEDFGCLEADNSIVREICEEGRNNNDHDQWRCCETDNCNVDFVNEQVVLPAEMITDRERVPATVGRTTTTEGAENGTTHGLDPELIKIIVVGVFSVALGLIVLLILIVACVILYYRRKVQKHCSASQTSGVPNRHGIVENEMDLSFGDTLTSRLSIAESDQEKDVASHFSAINKITVAVQQSSEQVQNLVLLEEMSVDQTLSE